MKRRIGWPEELAAFIESRRGTPFSWGSNDCCLFPADAVIAITEDRIDLALQWRGQYTDEFGAARLIASVGGLRGFASHHRLTQVAPAASGRGDIVLAAHEGRETFGVNAGNGYWCSPGEAGLVFRPMREAIAAYLI